MKLYLIATGNLGRAEFLERVKKTAQGGIDWIQLRVKEKEEARKIAEGILKLKDKYDFKLIINDFPRLAVELGADGAHIGKDDMGPVSAKKILRDKVLGVSCYNDIERGRKAERVGATYVAFGSIFPTSTKPEAVRLTPDTLTRAKRELKIDICVIGGINRENIDEVLALRPDIIAISSAIFLSDDPERETKFFKSRIERI